MAGFIPSRNRSACKGDFLVAPPSHPPLIPGVSGRGAAIVLIGFMGSGKSSVGRELAARTGLRRYDTDELVRERFGLPIAVIFEAHGEEAFREAETEVLGQIPEERVIIVTGGGIVLRSSNVELLQTRGALVYLSADEATLFARVSRRKTRPLLQTDNPRQTMSDLLRVREPLYRKIADVVIDTSARTHAEIADMILDEVAKLAERAA
jgi:shikimate kinase